MLLKFAYQDFLEDRQFKNTTEANIKNYKMLLGEFIDYCIKQEVVNLEDLTPIQVKSYLMMCQDKGNKAGTINTKLLRIRAFFNYCIESEYIKVSPAKKIKRQKEDVKIDVFTDEQIQQMLAYYRRIKQREKSYFAYRDYSMIILLLGTGIRRGELVNLKWSDVDFINNSITVFGKSRRRESIPLIEKLTKELSAYRVFCEQYFSEIGEFVFVNIHNKQMTGNSVMIVFRNLAKKMNFKDVRVSPHTFRHSFCHRMAMSGMSAFAIQKMMRHTNIAVTMRYVAMWGKDLKEANDRYNPLNNLEF